jgi:hypothetical protein
METLSETRINMINILLEDAKTGVERVPIHITVCCSRTE